MAIDKELFYASHGLKYPVVARQYTDDMQVKEKIYTKDEVVAMLTELRQEIDIMSDTVVEGRTTTITSWKGMRERICKLIQSKIDKLREKEQEQTAKNCESCRYYGSHHEVCNYCYKCSLWTEQKPTTKNDLAGDIMDFPKSFDEFAKDYGFRDKQEVYTNGSELIPVFRVKQWLEHISTTKNDLGVDCISRAKAQTEIEMNASRYTIAKERGGMGQVEWSDQLIKVSDAVGIIRKLPSVTPQEPTDKNFTKADIDAIAKAINKGWELRVNEILSKIRAEIEQLSTTTCTETRRIYIDADDFKENVLAIFDKYNAKSDNT